ncbi:MAG: hypothetical protein MJZ87_00515 [Bacteroidales bacterium]|nr:hypothetical protein [Bacteroidales bacterium]
MNRFKIKLNGVEMKQLAMTAVNVAKCQCPVSSEADLVLTETLERVWSRLRNMYRPDKDKYTVQMSAVETSVIYAYVVPFLVATDDPMLQSFGMRLEQDLFNQINRECNIYNAMNYGTR